MQEVDLHQCLDEAMNELDKASKEMFSLLQRREELHADLQPYLRKSRQGLHMLQHPLVYEIPYHPNFGAMANHRYEMKKKKVAEVLAAKDWSFLLHLYERPFRIAKLAEYASEMTVNEYWKQLAWVWVDAENAHEYGVRFLHKLFNRYPGARKGLMTEEELAGLANLPEIVTVFRGSTRATTGDLSWTLDKEVAFWFARRWKSPKDQKTLLIGEVPRDKIWAYFKSRNEEEIVVPRRAVRKIQKVQYSAAS
jgi:hypothetical protein